MAKKSLMRGMLAGGLTFVAGAALVFSGCSSMQVYQEETDTSEPRTGGGFPGPHTDG